MAPVATVPISFPPASDPTTAHVLLELPPELLKLLEESECPPSLTIKGRPNDSAVLCTPSSTYAIRTVQVSNELVLLTPPLPPAPSDDPFGPDPPPRRAGSGSAGEDRLEWRETLHEVLELQQTVPAMGRVEEVLVGQRWGGMAGDDRADDSDEAASDDDEPDGRPRKRTKYTLEHLRSIVQASDGELDAALRARNVVTVKGKLLPLPLARLPPLLSLCLSLLVIHAKSTVSAATFPARVSAESILDGLREQGIETALGRELLALYGSVARKGGAEAEEWVLEQEDARRMIRETGRGLLMKLDPDEPLPLTAFESQWRALLPDSLTSLAALPLLDGFYLLDPPPAPAPAHAVLLTPYPVSRLSPIAQDRFAELFLKRSKWRMADLKIYLSDLGSGKEVEKMVSKWGRVVKERETLSTRVKGRMVRSEGPVVEWVYSRAR